MHWQKPWFVYKLTQKQRCNGSYIKAEDSELKDPGSIPGSGKKTIYYRFFLSGCF